MGLGLCRLSAYTKARQTVLEEETEETEETEQTVETVETVLGEGPSKEEEGVELHMFVVVV